MHEHLMDRLLQTEINLQQSHTYTPQYVMNHSRLILISEKDALSIDILEYIFRDTLASTLNNVYILVLPETEKKLTVSSLVQHLENIYGVSYKLNTELNTKTSVTVLLENEENEIAYKLCDSLSYTSTVNINSIPKCFVQNKMLVPIIQQIPLSLTETSISTVLNKKLISNSETTFAVLPVVAVGGTFDHLHDGHKILLTVSAFLTKKTLIVGITGPELLKNKKYAEYMQSYQKRLSNVSSFLHMIRPSLKLDIHEINDICGPTAQVKDIDALVVSLESKKGADYVNKVRNDMGWKELDIYTVGVLGGTNTETFENKMSSTDYRRLEYMEDNLKES